MFLTNVISFSPRFFQRDSIMDERVQFGIDALQRCRQLRWQGGGALFKGCQCRAEDARFQACHQPFHFPRESLAATPNSSPTPPNLGDLTQQSGRGNGFSQMLGQKAYQPLGGGQAWEVPFKYNRSMHSTSKVHVTFEQYVNVGDDQKFYTTSNPRCQYSSVRSRRLR